ncbi:hypothetical protein [Woodsholea maritima]|uniref:hypothetical protein n=1 Tax=Woodsholea maritima TaxID=240237 RepID=UPI0003665217|nr:hypothetical protein [Woodsholea maritima]
MNRELINDRLIYSVGIFILAAESVEEFSVKFGIAEISSKDTISLIQASFTALCFILPVYYINKIKSFLIEHFENVKQSAKAQSISDDDSRTFVGKKNVLNALVTIANILSFLTPAIFTFIVVYAYFY